MFRKIRRWSFLLLLAFGLLVLICNIIVVRSARHRIFSSTENLPHNKAGLVLGTGKLLAGGGINPYFQNRVAAAAELYKAGKVECLIISGDHSKADYNEPQDFKDELVKLGIPAEKIVLDYAGFRTFDSMVRCREIFGQQSITIVSQPFHNQRALYIAKRLGMQAVAYNAKDVSASMGLRTNMREWLARVKVFSDLILRNKPGFLGEKIALPS